MRKPHITPLPYEQKYKGLKLSMLYKYDYNLITLKFTSFKILTALQPRIGLRSQNSNSIQFLLNTY